MVVHQLIFLILSVCLFTLNALDAFDLKSIEENASANENIEQMKNEFGKNTRVEYKRSKRNDDTDQGNLNKKLENNS